MSQIRREPSLRNYATIAALDAAVIGAGNVPAAGGTGEVLAKASTTDFDTEWVTRADLAADAAFSGRYEPLRLLADTTVESDSTNVTLSSIPQTFTNLRVYITLAARAAGSSFAMRANGVSTDTYADVRQNYGGSTGAARADVARVDQSYVALISADTQGHDVVTMMLDFPFYSVAGIRKTVLGSVLLRKSTGREIAHINAAADLNITDAITQLQFGLLVSSGITEGSRFLLYGV